MKMRVGTRSRNEIEKKRKNFKFKEKKWLIIEYDSRRVEVASKQGYERQPTRSMNKYLQMRRLTRQEAISETSFKLFRLRLCGANDKSHHLMSNR